MSKQRSTPDREHSRKENQYNIIQGALNPCHSPSFRIVKTYRGKRRYLGRREAYYTLCCLLFRNVRDQLQHKNPTCTNRSISQNKQYLLLHHQHIFNLIATVRHHHIHSMSYIQFYRNYFNCIIYSWRRPRQPPHSSTNSTCRHERIHASHTSGKNVEKAGESEGIWTHLMGYDMILRCRYAKILVSQIER